MGGGRPIRRIRCRPAGCFALAAFLSPPLDAHHGTFGFDGDRIVTLDGVVLEYRWTNPHSFVLIETRGERGEVRRIEVEADGPSLLEPLGVGADSLSPGDRVLVYVSPSRRPASDAVLGRELIREDGEVIALSVRYAREREVPGEPADSIIGTWVPDRGALFEFVPWRATWSLTAEGQASMDRYDVNMPFAHSECTPATAPTLMLYPTANVIESQGDHLTIDADWMGATRTVFVDGRDHPPVGERFLHGHSVGRWEEDALVIETTNFSDNPIGNAFGVASGPLKRLVERLSLVDGGLGLRYEFRLEDPDYLREPVSNEFVWHHRPDVVASSVECDLEAAGHYLSE